MKQEIKKIIEKVLIELQKDLGDFKIPEILVEIPKSLEHGDYSTNISMILAKELRKNPNEIANLIKEKIINFKEISKIEVIGGFINFYISDKYIVENIKKINKDFGKNNNLKNKKVILDYTDPNPFKEFHIGHLMSNAIGESLSRLFEFQGAKVKRVCYQGDVGIHVAKAIWGKLNNKKLKWPQAYAFGAQNFEESEKAKNEITDLNKIIYEKSDKKINKLYDQGKKESLKYFDNIYKKLGTKFDWLIFEGQTGPLGKKIAEQAFKNEVLEKGEGGAIIFKGEKYGLHTRVFINSMGIPTYEAKDFGLAKIKYQKFAYDKSIVITGNEINEYFKVMLKAMEQILPDLAKKTFHIGHGMLRLPEGKMSSRTGKVITGESLINQLQEMVLEKIKDRKLSQKDKKIISEKVAISAIKYSVLKQSAGSDIIYDFNKSVSFNGDSGPYLQYSFTRALSVLEKSKSKKIKASFKNIPEKIGQLEKMMIQFPEVVERSAIEYQPHYVATYLTQLASCFNSFYAQEQIVNKEDKFSPYKIAVTQAFVNIMQNGLWLLGISTLKKM